MRPVNWREMPQRRTSPKNADPHTAFPTASMTIHTGDWLCRTVAANSGKNLSSRWGAPHIDALIQKGSFCVSP